MQRRGDGHDISKSREVALPTLLLPAMQCTPRLFAAQLPMLWRFGPVMVADTTRGEDIAAMAREVLAHAPPVFRLLGLSMGGYLAFEILRQAPERVQALVLCNTRHDTDTPARRSERLRLMKAVEQRGFIPPFNPALVSTAAASDRGLAAICNAMAREVGADALLRQLRVILSRPDSSRDLAGIRCRTLVIAGAEDQLTPPSVARTMAEAIPGAELAIIEGAGHLPTLEVPDAFNEVLATWLSRDASH